MIGYNVSVKFTNCDNAKLPKALRAMIYGMVPKIVYLDELTNDGLYLLSERFSFEINLPLDPSFWVDLIDRFELEKNLLWWEDRR